MTTQTAAQVPQTQDINAPVFNIQRVYLKGTSLEMPHAPEIFLGQNEITMDLNVTPKLTELAPGVHELVLHATLTAKDAKSNKIWFLLEIDQAGIFELRNIPAEHVEGLLNIRCPTILHGHLRVQIADTLNRATMPQFLLPEFDYAHIAQQAKEQQVQAEQAAKGLVH
jgi:preprotein translocase subunit SecB